MHCWNGGGANHRRQLLSCVVVSLQPCCSCCSSGSVVFMHPCLPVWPRGGLLLHGSIRQHSVQLLGLRCPKEKMPRLCPFVERLINLRQSPRVSQCRLCYLDSAKPLTLVKSFIRSCMVCFTQRILTRCKTRTETVGNIFAAPPPFCSVHRSRKYQFVRLCENPHTQVIFNCWVP